MAKKIEINPEDYSYGNLENLFRTRAEWKAHVNNMLTLRPCCEICGKQLDKRKKNGKLKTIVHIHHRYESFKMSDYMNLDPSRFMVLCASCHDWVHAVGQNPIIKSKDYFIRLPDEQRKELFNARRAKKCEERTKSVEPITE